MERKRALEVNLKKCLPREGVHLRLNIQCLYVAGRPLMRDTRMQMFSCIF